MTKKFFKIAAFSLILLTSCTSKAVQNTISKDKALLFELADYFFATSSRFSSFIETKEDGNFKAYSKIANEIFEELKSSEKANSDIEMIEYSFLMSFIFNANDSDNKANYSFYFTGIETNTVYVIGEKENVFEYEDKNSVQYLKVSEMHSNCRKNLSK